MVLYLCIFLEVVFMKVAILGAGAYGGALGEVLERAGHKIRFYDPIKYRDVALDSVTSWSEMILLVVPALKVKELLRQFSLETFSKHLIVATKGVMGLELWEKFRSFELMAGPGFAREILMDKKIRLTLASKNGVLKESTSRNLGAESLFLGTNISFDKTDDVLGVALLSGLKNIYAIEAGRRGLEADTSELEEYVEDVLLEAKQFLIYNGGFAETVELSAGRGDFYLTAGSEESRNYRFGKEVLSAKKKVFERGANFRKNNTVEGLFAAEEIEKRGLYVPKNCEILTDVLRRIQNATKR